MSNFQAIAMIMAIVVANMSIYLVVDRWIQERSDAIVSGVVRGVPVSTEHRWMILHNSWVISATGLSVFQIFMAAGFIMIGRNVDGEGVQLFAYLNAFLLFVAATLGGLAHGVLWYRRLRSELHQAEAD